MRAFMKKVRQLSTKSMIELLSLALYFLLQFPGRIGADANTAMALMRHGSSTSNWTEIYFWFLKILTFNGHYIALASFLGLAVFIFALHFLTDQLWSISSLKSPVIYFAVILSPLVGVYGMTVDHNLQATTGNILLIGLIIKIYSQKNLTKIDYSIAIFGMFLSAMSFIGVAGMLGFFASLLASRFPLRKLLSLVLISVFFVLGSTLLPAAPRSLGFKFTPLLMDIRCLVPNPNVEISKSDLEFLATLGPIETWKDPVSCIAAESSEFVRASVTPENQSQIIGLWLRLIRDNPRYVLLAHVQRASVALPPGITGPQPNGYETNLVLPLGSNTPRWLHTFDGVLDDSRYQTEKIQTQPKFLGFLQYAVIFPTILLNNFSWFWGWGGLWLLIGSIVVVRRWSWSGLRFLVPVYMSHLFFFVMSPTPNPRYTYLAITTGLIMLSVTKIKIGDQLK
jgi:hypothetical protein